ncbi:MAG: ZIP family metal transporter [Candidatus Krumholzibacteriia bacterium]
MHEVSTFTVFSYATFTAVATGFGALPFLFVPNMTRRWLGISNAIAVGLMLAASFSLIYEGLEYSLFRVLAGLLLGLLFIRITQAKLARYEDLRIGNLGGIDARKAFLVIGVMTLHSFTEGVGVGVSFGGGEELGVFITSAIAIHNIPEGLAISLVVIPRGLSVTRAALWAILSSLPQPLTAVPAFAFVEAFTPLLPVGFGFAAGAMIWMVFSELVPEAVEDSSPNTVGVTVTLAVALMIVFQEILRA